MLSPAARKHFALFRDPFCDDVQGPEDVFLAADQRYVREALYQTARHGGFVAIVGESGSGKTVLRRDLEERIVRESLPIRIIKPRSIDKRTLSARAICEAIVDDLRPGETPRRSLEALARQVERILIDSAKADRVHALIIEEAHDLSIAALKYLKRFWEIELGFRKLLAIVLIGQPELRHLLDEQRHPEAREVIRRCEVVSLLPLDDALDAYLRLKFGRVGKDAAELLADDAADAIRAKLISANPETGRSVSGCVPLRVNNLVVSALNEAAIVGASKLSAALIKGIRK